MKTVIISGAMLGITGGIYLVSKTLFWEIHKRLLFIVAALLAALTLVYGAFSPQLQTRTLALTLVMFTGSIGMIAIINALAQQQNTKISGINVIFTLLYFPIFFLQDNMLGSGISMSFFLLVSEIMETIKRTKNSGKYILFGLKLAVWIWFLMIGLAVKGIVK